MNSAYFDTRFRTDEAFSSWPESFVIITAYSTTGERWADTECARADEELEQTLRGRTSQLRRVTGYSPTTGHAEPGWACTVPFDEACNIGLSFRQDAIYVVNSGMLYVTYCDARRLKLDRERREMAILWSLSAPTSSEEDLDRRGLRPARPTLS